jgi:ParB family chromosome partitioning protein
VRNVVVDGHTRLEAARRAGLVEIPVVFRNFADEDDALQYAINAQKNRRNLTDAEIVRLVKLLDSRMTRGGDRRSAKARSNAPDGAIENGKRSSTETARKIGVSPRKVERVRQIIDCADPETITAVESGNMSINRAAGASCESRRAAGNPDARQVAKRAVKQLHAIEAELQGHGDVFVLALKKLSELIAEIGKAADAAAQ